MGTAPLPDWVIPPDKGFYAEDLDRLPALPPHTQLIDGTLVFAGPQTLFHKRALFLLEQALHAAAPAKFTIQREMTVILAPRQRPEPDVMITTAGAEEGMGQTSFQARDAVLVAEVISLESCERDTKRKPSLYAEAGIPHFWQVENIEDRAVVRVFELDQAAEAYKLTGIYHDRLELAVPFPIDIDLTKIGGFGRAATSS
jgi:Uma2 family endonuclease